MLLFHCQQNLAMEVFMNKENILERSRRENKNGDEREKQVDLASYAYGAIFLIISFVTLVITKILVKENGINDILFMFEMYISALFLYKYRKLKNKSNLCLFLVWIFASLINLYLFIVRG